MEIELNKSELSDLETFCKLNGLNIEQFVKKCYISGFAIEKYGLLGEEKEKIIYVVDEEKIKSYEYQMSVMGKELDDCNKKRKMLEETLSKLREELVNLKNS